MNRRNFITTTLGTMAAATAGISAEPSVAKGTIDIMDAVRAGAWDAFHPTKVLRAFADSKDESMYRSVSSFTRLHQHYGRDDSSSAFPNLHQHCAHAGSVWSEAGGDPYYRYLLNNLNIPREVIDRKAKLDNVSYGRNIEQVFEPGSISVYWLDGGLFLSQRFHLSDGDVFDFHMGLNKRRSEALGQAALALKHGHLGHSDIISKLHDVDLRPGANYTRLLLDGPFIQKYLNAHRVVA